MPCVEDVRRAWTNQLFYAQTALTKRCCNDQVEQIRPGVLDPLFPSPTGDAQQGKWAAQLWRIVIAGTIVAEMEDYYQEDQGSPGEG